MTNENARYTFTSLGGGLKSIELVKYPEKISRKKKTESPTNGLATLNDHAPAPVLAVLGGDAVQGDGVFSLVPIESGVRAEKTLTNGIRVVKEFHLGTNYLISATAKIENTSEGPVLFPAQEWVVGTATPMSADDDGMSVGLMWYDGGKKEEIGAGWFENRTLGCFPGVPRSEYRAGTSNVVWTSVHNQFFTLVTMPTVPAHQVVSRPVELPKHDDVSPNTRKSGPPRGFQTAFVYPAASLAPGQSVEHQFQFFAGPKEYRTLARIAERFQNNVDLVMGFGGFFGFFSKGLLLGMNWIHHTFKFSYGWAIIVITIIIKVLFWPLTQASTRSMKRMAALQPQMKALQEKYKDDPAKMNKKMMEFWKEHKVNPMGGCLPMLIQMPVFIGFFYMIRSAIELRGAGFLWITDLSRPDTLFYIPGFHFPFNLLPLLMGATMLWQSHLTPPSPGMDPMQQKIMRYMPLMFLVFLYNFSSGLALYWTVQNLLSILQTKLTKAKDPVQSPATASPLTPPPKKKK
jgi:YidC/Oxa1 family membrane protein insertase